MNIGILGGTFDPIHSGHLYLARTGLKILGLNRVLFMVSHSPPHKARQKTTSPFHRYAMVSLDLLAPPDLYPCNWELEHGTLSYTIDTFKHFSQIYPHHRYSFLAGSDSLREIHLWKDHETLLRQYSFLFLQRPGATVDIEQLPLAPDLRRNIRLIDEQERPEVKAGRSFLITLAAPSISGTEIRRMISDGRDPEPGTVSPAVLHYIKKHRLYEGRKDHPDPGL